MERIKENKIVKKGEKVMGNDKKHTIDAVLQEKKREMQLDQAFELSNSASVTDCTGSVPAAPVTEEQGESYEEAYHFQPENVTKKKV